MADTTLTWLGHASFRLDTADGRRIYIDPFLNGNPKCPDSEKNPETADIIALTHAH
ncbi:MAG: MBL fold metallo-hydrolase, partial [Actinobacteria bacterium]|nr:MBL fold metallo-hydrolase [Actinomycetota bacterium]